MSSTKQMIDEAKQAYGQLGSVYCKALKKDVVFNKHGWRHILFESNGHRRPEQSIRLRLHLLKNAADVVKLSAAVVKIDEIEVKVRSGSQVAKFYELSSPVEGAEQDITVVIREFEIGNPHFYTIRKTKRLHIPKNPR